MGIIKGKWIGTVVIDFEFDENEPGLLSFEELKEKVKGSSDMIRDLLEDEFDACVTVDQQRSDIWRASDG